MNAFNSIYREIIGEPAYLVARQQVMDERLRTDNIAQAAERQAHTKHNDKKTDALSFSTYFKNIKIIRQRSRVNHDVDGSCVVCQTEYSDPYNQERIVSTPCGHLFHHKCLRNWHESMHNLRNTCPLCRTRLFKLDDEPAPAQPAPEDDMMLAQAREQDMLEAEYEDMRWHQQQGSSPENPIDLDDDDQYTEPLPNQGDDDGPIQIFMNAARDTAGADFEVVTEVSRVHSMNVETVPGQGQAIHRVRYQTDNGFENTVVEADAYMFMGGSNAVFFRFVPVVSDESDAAQE